MRLILGNYFTDVERRSEPLASPLLDPELPKAMPPTLILAGANDTLYPQSERLATMLKAAGVDVTYHVFDDADHNYIEVETTPEPIRESLKFINEHLMLHLP
jgi:acetyl esterase